MAGMARLFGVIRSPATYSYRLTCRVSLVLRGNLTPGSSTACPTLPHCACRQRRRDRNKWQKHELTAGRAIIERSGRPGKAGAVDHRSDGGGVAIGGTQPGPRGVAIVVLPCVPHQEGLPPTRYPCLLLRHTAIARPWVNTFTLNDHRSFLFSLGAGLAFFLAASLHSVLFFPWPHATAAPRPSWPGTICDMLFAL